MRWLLKAAAHWAVGAMPGERLNYLIARRITRSLPVSDSSLADKIKQAEAHVDAFERLSAQSTAGGARFYEFGAGWDLTVPLAYWRLGVQRQLVVDRSRNAKLALINDVIERMEALPSRPPASGAAVFRRVESMVDLATWYGIDYRAPVDSSDTMLRAGSVDFVSSTDTLEHLPLRTLRRILKECRRILKPGGLISCDIDLKDHYAYVTSGLSDYNFLRYPAAVWRLLSPPSHYQNRLRADDYIDLFMQAGFTVVEEQAEAPSAADLAELRSVRIRTGARTMPIERAAIKRLRLVAKVAG